MNIRISQISGPEVLIELNGPAYNAYGVYSVTRSDRCLWYTTGRFEFPTYGLYAAVFNPQLYEVRGIHYQLLTLV